jgi:hypothetical protein
MVQLAGQFLGSHATFQQLSGGPCVDLGLDVLQSPHDSSTLACGTRQEAENCKAHLEV